MAQLIDKTIISEYNPRDTRVHWIDTSGELPVSKYFINGMWKTVGGSNNSGSNRQDYGVLILNGNVVNSFIPREATAEDVAKFTVDSINVGTLVIDINGCIPYILQVELEAGDISILTLGSVALNEYERTAYYYMCDTLSVLGEASINMWGWYVSDDNTLMAQALSSNDELG